MLLADVSAVVDQNIYAGCSSVLRQLLEHQQPNAVFRGRLLASIGYHGTVMNRAILSALLLLAA
ncbi:MAG: hypothetical protein ACI8RZ_002437, partial [Myxococcota bacterium]